MAFWNGSHWVHNEAGAASRRARAHSRFAVAGHAVLVSALILGLTAGSVFAAKGGGGKGGGGKDGGTSGGHSLAVVMVSDTNGDGLPNHGETITFDVSTTATRPFVSLNCYQAGAWVYAASVGYFPDYPWSQNFILAATSWPAGAASCTATLYTSKDGIRTTTLATLKFEVAA